LKPVVSERNVKAQIASVAFTPKGGCPLKRQRGEKPKNRRGLQGSIHPQGWVPIET